jgi:hypothetical protein
MKTSTPPAMTEASASKLASLAASFPCLAGRPGVEPFNVAELGAFAAAEPAEGETPANLDATAAAAFIVWLFRNGYGSSPRPMLLDERKHRAIADGSAMFSLADVARHGSAVTRAIVAAWLAAPWFPEAAAQ